MSRKLAANLWRRLLAVAEEEVADVLRALPAHLREAAEKVTLVYESQPSTSLVRDGIEADTLGLFVGDAFAETSSPLPPEIILFVENLWDAADKSEESFREEVRTTYLHELGHYLGLDEDDLTERGLE